MTLNWGNNKKGSKEKIINMILTTLIHTRTLKLVANFWKRKKIRNQ